MPITGLLSLSLRCTWSRNHDIEESGHCSTLRLSKAIKVIRLLCTYFTGPIRHCKSKSLRSSPEGLPPRRWRPRSRAINSSKLSRKALGKSPRRKEKDHGARRYINHIKIASHMPRSLNYTSAVLRVACFSALLLFPSPLRNPRSKRKTRGHARSHLSLTRIDARGRKGVGERREKR